MSSASYGPNPMNSNPCSLSLRLVDSKLRWPRVVVSPFLSPQINKQNEQMHGLLAIALTMYPMRIDESIHTQLREKYGDKMLRMQKG